MIARLRARLGYRLARRMMTSRALVARPALWRWMERQFARMARFGDREARSFYGHLLFHRGKGDGARLEGIRLLRLAAEAGEGKAAYQMGVISLSEDASHGPDAVAAAHWWQRAADAGHPLAATRLAQLYRAGGHGLKADASEANRYEARAEALGF